MFIMGTNFVGGDLACALSPTDLYEIPYVEIKNGIYDDLYITHNIVDKIDENIPEEWDWDTVLHAKFNDSTNAGNMDWNLSTVSHLLVKRKKANEFKWRTIDVIKVQKVEDFELIGIDYTNENNTKYLYAVVPTLYGIEGGYSITDVDSKFDGIFIVEKDNIYGTKLTDGFCDYTRNHPNTPTPTIHNKYPTTIKTSDANYDTGTCTGIFMEVNDECDLVTDDPHRIKYQKEVIDMLSNGKIKMLKNFDGYTRLVTIDDQIQDNAETTYDNRKITFNWTEVGDCNSEADLYYSGLSDIKPEWWSE